MRIKVYYEKKKTFNFNFRGWLLENKNKEKSGEEVQYKFVQRPKSFILWAKYNDMMIDDNCDNNHEEEKEEDEEEDMLQ